MQASHWHKFCFRNASQCGVPSRAILVARSSIVCTKSCPVVPSITRKLRTVHEMRDTQCHACALINVVMTSRDSLEVNFWTFQNCRQCDACFITKTNQLHCISGWSVLCTAMNQRLSFNGRFDGAMHLHNLTFYWTRDMMQSSALTKPHVLCHVSPNLYRRIRSGT